jgi:hypothetical protein
MCHENPSCQLHSKFCGTAIIPYPDYKTYYEREQLRRYDCLDQRYAELLRREVELKRAYFDPSNAGEYNLLLSRLDAVQHEMAQVLKQLSNCLHEVE